MEELDLSKAFDELFKPTDPQEGAALKNTTETPSPSLLDSILPPEGQAWLNGLNRFCRRAVENDLRAYGPDLFAKYWGSLRDTLQKLERDLGPSDNWKGRLVLKLLNVEWSIPIITHGYQDMPSPTPAHCY